MNPHFLTHTKKERERNIMSKLFPGWEGSDGEAERLCRTANTPFLATPKILEARCRRAPYTEAANPWSNIQRLAPDLGSEPHWPFLLPFSCTAAEDLPLRKGARGTVKWRVVCRHCSEMKLDSTDLTHAKQSVREHCLFTVLHLRRSRPSWDTNRTLLSSALVLMWMQTGQLTMRGAAFSTSKTRASLMSVPTGLGT